MSDCVDENTALELLEGRLESAARAGVERHLEGCADCRELVAELAKSDGEEPAPAADVTAAAPAAMLRSGAEIGPYQILETIGAGSAGTVFRALDLRTRQIVALKLVTDPALRLRFAREAQTLSRLDHDAIVRYVGHGGAEGGMYLAMEWLEGEDLEQRFRRGPLGWEGARTIGLRLSAALAHAHALGCVHRDLSPRNVFLPDGRLERAKLLDFGLVRVDGDALARTATNAVLGTPFYMSPEQIRDPKRVTDRADLFGLGVLLYEAIAGARPFEGDDLFTVWIKIVDQPAPDLRGLARGGVPEPLVRLVEAMLAKDPAARPASAQEVNERLLALSGVVPTSTAVLPPVRLAATHHVVVPAPAPHAAAQLAPTAPDMRPLAPAPPPRWPSAHPPQAVSMPPYASAPAPAPIAPPAARSRVPLLVAAGFLGVGLASAVGAFAYDRLARRGEVLVITGGGDHDDDPKESDEKPPPAATFPAACTDGETLRLRGDWSGTGPAITAVTTNCTIEIKDATIRAGRLFGGDASNVTLTLDNVTLETTDTAASAGMNFKVHLRRSKIRAQRDGLVGGMNLSVEELADGAIESKAGVAIRGTGTLTVSAEAAKIAGTTGAIVSSGNVEVTLRRGSTVEAHDDAAIRGGMQTKVDVEGGTIAGGVRGEGNTTVDGSGVVFTAARRPAIAGAGLQLALVDATVRATGAAAIEASRTSRVTLTGTKVDGESAAIAAREGATVLASAKTELRSKGDGIVATTGADVRLDEATLEAGGVAIRAEANARIRLTGARVTGTRGGVGADVNLTVDGRGATLDGGGGPGIEGTVNARVAFRDGVLRGAPATRFGMKPLTRDLDGTTVEGAHVVGR